jgi:hypothetical protein
VREIVIVISDLYLEPSDRADVSGASATGMPGLEHLARFARRSPLSEGWRAWVARWAALAQYAAAAPAAVAAAPLAGELANRAVWLATPLHLIAGLTRLHLERRSLLRLTRAEAEALAASFREAFRGSGFDLHPLETGELLLSGPPGSAHSGTTEPARMLLIPVAEALAAGDGAPALRRLSAEIEMWLHGHPVNARREERGAPVITTLWPWGGGPPALAPRLATHAPPDPAYGSDSYVRGLWQLAGGETGPMPVDWRTVAGEPRARRALGVVEVAELLQTEASWHLTDALREIDRRLVSPSLEALHRGELERFALLANDRCLLIAAADRWRLWRRGRAALAGLR